MREIQLNQGEVVKLDDEDYDLLSDFHWCYRPERDDAPGYAIRHVRRDDGRYATEYMHRVIMDPPPGYEVIFLNYDRLDCRRENLRVVTKTESRQHHRPRRNVRFDPITEKWTAHVKQNGVRYRVGSFSSKMYADAAYDEELAIIKASAAEDAEINARIKAELQARNLKR